MLSAICFNLAQSNILSSGNGVKHNFQQMIKSQYPHLQCVNMTVFLSSDNGE